MPGHSPPERADGSFVQQRLPGAFPWGTLAVNAGTSSVGAATLKVGTLIVGEDGPGTFSITDAGAQVTVSETLHVGPQGMIDVTMAGLAVFYDGESPFEEIHASAASGYHGGAWDGTGIHSSAAADDPQGLTAVGVIDDGEKVLVKYTWYGDANLDGVLDTNDYDRINTNWLLWTQEGLVPEGGFRWAVGDFNYDGTIDTNDYDKINNAWLLSGGAFLGGGVPVPTPEPATLALLAAGGLVLLRRKT